METKGILMGVKLLLHPHIFPQLHCDFCNVELWGQPAETFQFRMPIATDWKLHGVVDNVICGNARNIQMAIF